MGSFESSTEGEDETVGKEINVETWSLLKTLMKTFSPEEEILDLRTKPMDGVMTVFSSSWLFAVALRESLAEDMLDIH